MAVMAAQTSDPRVAERVAALAVRRSPRADADGRLWSQAVQLPVFEGEVVSATAVRSGEAP